MDERKSKKIVMEKDRKEYQDKLEKSRKKENNFFLLFFTDLKDWSSSSF